ALTFAATMIIIFLMWVGASPGGTGGGIKTSTLAIATLNFFSLAKGKDRLEVFKREISDNTIKRAFATISLSLIVIGMAIFAISIFDRKIGLLEIAFECFSAYTTTGLSLGITAGLSSGSKAVLIICMFIGRVSMLTLLIAFFRQVKNLKYRYPTEEISIN
ncbi:MAG: TrkH family potassium uptake protein, partial [Crocinitomicaceae bacterium]|nr:TrkH family potassium uptake protein [Crocinitomicaceae bacterium]